MAKRAKRADGRLQKKFRVDGKQYIVYGKTERELFENEKQKRDEIERGLETRNNPTMTEYYNRWSETRVNTVKESTLRGQIKMYKAMKDIYIESASRNFGEIKLQDIKIDDLRVLQAELHKTRKTQTVNDYLAHLNHCLSDAMKERVISYNPYCLLTPLKRTEEKARDTHHRALSLEEQQKFFECERCKSSYYYNVCRFALCTGMRAGEIGALKKTDIRNNMIYVKRTITRTSDGTYIVGENAKTESGRRCIPVNDQIKRILFDQHELNDLLDGNVVALDDLIFKAPERGLLMDTPMNREIKRICKVAGIEYFTMHAFRDTFATRCIENNMSIKTLQELMGHKSYNITMSLYGHCLPETKRQAMDNMIFAM